MGYEGNEEALLAHDLVVGAPTAVNVTLEFVSIERERFAVLNH
jgi:hypothetical protein